MQLSLPLRVSYTTILRAFMQLPLRVSGTTMHSDSMQLSLCVSDTTILRARLGYYHFES